MGKFIDSIRNEKITPEEIAEADHKIEAVRAKCIEAKVDYQHGEDMIKDAEAYVGRRLKVYEVDALVMGRLLLGKLQDGEVTLLDVLKHIERESDAEAAAKSKEEKHETKGEDHVVEQRADA